MDFIPPPPPPPRPPPPLSLSRDNIKGQYSFNYLILFHVVNDKPRPLEHDQVKDIKGELLEMRDRINKLLDRLDSISEERNQNKQFEQRERDARKEHTQGK